MQALHVCAERPKDVTNGGASAFATDSPHGDGEEVDGGGSNALLESLGTPPSSACRAGHPFFNSLLENEVHTAGWSAIAAVRGAADLFRLTFFDTAYLSILC